MNQSTSTQSNSLPTLRSTLWLPLLALAFLYSLITISWMVYRLHLPALLTRVNLAATLAPTILLIESMLAIALEPLVGALSDRLRRTQNRQFPLIIAGVGLASGLFIALPFIPALGLPGNLNQILLLSGAILWACAISLFRSPALALFRGYANPTRWTQAASLLTMAGAIAAGIAPLVSAAVKAMDAMLAFSLVAGLLLAAGLWLRRTTPNRSLPLDHQMPDRPIDRSRSGSASAWVVLLGLGFSTTLMLRLVVETLPILLKVRVPDITPSLWIVLLFAVMAIAALPLGRLATSFGNRQIMQYGILLTAGCWGLTPLMSNGAIAVLVMLGLGVGFAAITNGTLPLVLQRVTSRQTALGMGMLFGGAAAATSLYVGVLAKLPGFTLSQSLGLGFITLGLLAVCVGWGNQEFSSSPQT